MDGVRGWKRKRWLFCLLYHVRIRNYCYCGHESYLTFISVARAWGLLWTILARFATAWNNGCISDELNLTIFFWFSIYNARQSASRSRNSCRNDASLIPWLERRIWDRYSGLRMPSLISRHPMSSSCWSALPRHAAFWSKYLRTGFASAKLNVFRYAFLFGLERLNAKVAFELGHASPRRRPTITVEGQSMRRRRRGDALLYYILGKRGMRCSDERDWIWIR